MVTALQCGQNVTEQRGGGREDVCVGEGYTVCVWGREREREEFCLITDGLMNLAYFAVSRGFGGRRRG